MYLFLDDIIKALLSGNSLRKRLSVCLSKQDGEPFVTGDLELKRLDLQIRAYFFLLLMSNCRHRDIYKKTNEIRDTSLNEREKVVKGKQRIHLCQFQTHGKSCLS